MNILLFSSLFPNPLKPNKCPFLYSLYSSQSKFDNIFVVAPVPFIDFFQSIFKYDSIKFKSDNFLFPPYVYIPKYFKSTDPYLMALMSFNGLRRVIKKNNIDLIHSHYLYPDSYSAAILAKMFSLPLVVTAHGSDLNILPNSLVIKNKIKCVIESSTFITTVSSSLKTSALEICDVNNIEVIPNGVDLSRFSCSKRLTARAEIGLSEKDIVFLGVGSFIKLKRFDLLIRSFSRLELSDKKLVLLGDGPEINKLVALVDALGLSDIVLFPGWVCHDLVPKYMNSADILCISSRSEGWPTIIFEALACRTLVVGTPVGGIPEALGYGKFGIIADDLSENSFYDALSRSVSLLGSSTSDSSEYASKHDWDSIAKKYRDIYKKII